MAPETESHNDTGTGGGTTSDTPHSTTVAVHYKGGSGGVIWPNKKPKAPRQLGEPPIHALIVGGTFSLALLLWIGAAAIAIVAATQRSDFDDADLQDFVSLGEQGCRIERTVRYRTIDQEINTLNRVCLEQWEYQVRVMSSTQEEQQQQQQDVFVTDWLSLRACTSSCSSCPESRLYGRDHYAGVDVLRRGEAITNATFVECWAPRIPVNQLSDFYNCGPYQNNGSAQNNTCYVLLDPTDKLDDELDSYELTMLGAYVGFAGGFILFLAYGWCVCYNKKVLARDAKILQERKQQQTTGVTTGKEESEEQEDTTA
jgi:hypothetical protein